MTFTELPAPCDPRAFYVIDLHAFVWRFASGARKDPSLALARWIGGVLKRAKGGHVVAADDPPPGSGATFRHELLAKSEFAGYKADRKRLDGDRLDVYLEVRDSAKNLLDDIGIPIVVAPGFEADDVIATLAYEAAERFARVVIVGADRDLLQLVGQRDDAGAVMLWDGTEEYPCKVSGAAECIREMEVRPCQIPDYFAIVGGKNNIPGVPKLGSKAAVEILKSFPTLGDAVTFACTDRSADLRMTGKARAALAAHFARARLSLTLATLRHDVPLDFERILAESLYNPE